MSDPTTCPRRSASSRRGDPLLGSAWRSELAWLGVARSEHLCTSGFRDRRGRRALRRAIEQQGRARALAAVRNVPDAQARPRPSLRERLAAQALACKLTRHSRDAAPRCFATARVSPRTCRRHAVCVKHVSMGADGDLFCSARRVKQRLWSSSEAADSSLASLRRRRSSAPGAVERH